MREKPSIIEELKMEEQQYKLKSNQKIKTAHSNENITSLKINKKNRSKWFNIPYLKKPMNKNKDNKIRTHVLLSNLLIILLIIDVSFLIIGMIYPAYLIHGIIDVFILIATFILLLILLFLCYQGYYEPSSISLIIIISGILLFNIFLDVLTSEKSQYANIAFSIVYFIIPVILSALLLSKKFTMYLIIAISLSLIVPFIFIHNSFHEYMLNPFLFFLFTAIIVLFFKYELEKRESIRNEKIIQTKKETEEILNGAADGIRVIDTKYRIINANKTMAEMSGIRQQNMIGQSCKICLSSNTYCGTSECSLRKILNDKKEFSRISTRYNASGEELICLENVKPLFNEHDEIIGIIEDFRDITELKRIERQLQEEKNRAQMYLDIANVIIFVLNTDGTIKLLNKKGYDILNYSEEELIGKNWFELVFPNEMIEKGKQIFNEYVTKQREFPDKRQQKIITKSGDERIAEWRITPLTDDSNEIIGVVGSGMDITYEIQAKKAKEIADRILDKRSRAFHILYDTVVKIEQHDERSMITVLCENLKRITAAEIGYFGVYSQEDTILHCHRYAIKDSNDNETIGFDCKTDFSIPLTISNMEKIVDKRIQKYQHEDENSQFLPDQFFKTYPDCNKGNCYLVSYPMIDHQFLIGFICMREGEKLQLKDMIDAYMDLCGLIYQRNKSHHDLEDSEKKYKELSNLLEDKVKDRTEYIEKLLKQKDEFIYQLGHDLKSPLNPLLNLIPIVQKKTADPECQKIFDILIRNTGHMKNLVTKTLELAQLNSSSTQFSFEKVNLRHTIDDIIEKNKYMFEQAGIDIILDIDNEISIELDPLRFTELIDNLLSNAVKYSPDGGTVRISAEIHESMLNLSIQDTGMGMSSGQLDHVFDEFYKADGARHDFDSSGLGMPICKKIVEKHSGNIWVESEGVGKGLNVTFSLPLKQKVILNNC